MEMPKSIKVGGHKGDFALFKKYFKEYQQRFGLIGYKVYFKHEPLDGCFANISITQADMVATVRLSSATDPNSEPHRDVRQSAKHEALHLLIFKLEHRACSRYVLEQEIYEIGEELVFKLERLIPDITGIIFTKSDVEPI